MSVARGRVAEDLAAVHLESSGYQIIDHNWRNRWCEIDIVARLNGVVCFVEVKYRRDTGYGFAAEYITRDKANRLRRAALAWCQAHAYNGSYQIDVIAVEGELENPSVTLTCNAITDF